MQRQTHGPEEDRNFLFLASKRYSETQRRVKRQKGSQRFKERKTETQIDGKIQRKAKIKWVSEGRKNLKYQ